MQLIMPNLSFTGHLCGILIGTLQLHGLLSYLFPKESRLLEFETRTSLTWLTSMPSFVPTTHEPTTGNYSLLRQPVCQTLQVLKSRAFTALEALKVYIFGRGVTANANTRFAPTEIGDEREYLPLSNPENSELV
jgi:rhomboid domain-containing protein 1